MKMARRVINRGQGCNLKEQKNNSPLKQFLDKQKGGMAEDRKRRKRKRNQDEFIISIEIKRKPLLFFNDKVTRE